MDGENDFKYKRITIIGLGLIGGSLGQSLKLNSSHLEIVGVDKKSVIEKAISCGAIDRGTTVLQKGVKDSDIIVIATPVQVILKMLSEIKPYLKKGCLITDTGSTKTEIMKEAEKVLTDEFDFIGGHPIAGSEKEGITSANPDLFKNKPYLLIPKKRNSPSAKLKLSTLINSICAIEMDIGIKEHDELLALISHLPHLIAVIMTNMFGLWSAEKNKEDYLKIGGNYFQEMTRVATSPFSIWKDIFETNSTNITDFLLKLEKLLAAARKKITDNPDLLEEDFRTAKFFKEKMLEAKKDLLNNFLNRYRKE